MSAFGRGHRGKLTSDWKLAVVSPIATYLQHDSRKLLELLR